MKEFDTDEFFTFIEENNVYGFFKNPVTLKSGRTSHFYANWRTVASDVYLADRLADFLCAFVKSRGIGVDTFFGVPEGATKLGVLAQYKWAVNAPEFCKGSHVLAMGRAKPKAHGRPEDRFFVGEPRGRTVVVEDVTTTGGSLYNTLVSLKDAGVHVGAVVSLTNRMVRRDDGTCVEDLIGGLNLPFYSMSTAPELLPRIYNRVQPGAEIGKAVELEFEQYGLAPVRLGV